MTQSNARRAGRFRIPLFSFLLAIAALVGPMDAALAAQAPLPAALHGAITTQNGAAFLPGALVTITEPSSGAIIAESTSDQTDNYELTTFPPARSTSPQFRVS